LVKAAHFGFTSRANPPEEREEIAALLSKWDERLRFSTRPTLLALAPRANEVDSFWWSRVPLRLTLSTGDLGGVWRHSLKYPVKGAG
jgi:hypothetical protein